MNKVESGLFFQNFYRIKVHDDLRQSGQCTCVGLTHDEL